MSRPITESVTRKFYKRTLTGESENSALMVSETIMVSDSASDSEVELERFKLLRKLELHICLAFWIKGYLSTDEYKEECINLERRYEKAMNHLKKSDFEMTGIVE